MGVSVQTPLWEQTPLGTDTPQEQTPHRSRHTPLGSRQPPRPEQQAGGTHPTGMHTCLHKNPVIPSPWNKASYVMITVDYPSPSTISVQAKFFLGTIQWPGNLLTAVWPWLLHKRSELWHLIGWEITYYAKIRVMIYQQVPRVPPVGIYLTTLTITGLQVWCLCNCAKQACVDSFRLSDPYKVILYWI